MDAPWSGIGSVIAAVIGATALVAVNIYAKRIEAREKAAAEIRVKKTEIYEQLIDLMFSQITAAKQGKKQLSEFDLIKAFARMMPKLIVWASPAVIQHWNLIKHLPDQPNEAIKTIAVWDKFFRLIREDLGHQDAALPEYELSKLFVNDLDDHIPSRSSSK